MSVEEKQIYYDKLRKFCAERKLCTTTPGALTVAPKLKKVTEKIAKKVSEILAGGEVEIVVDGIENIPEGPIIFASTHQGVMDGFVWIPYCSKHALIFHGKEVNKLLLMAQINTGLILASKNLNNTEQRRNAKAVNFGIVYGIGAFSLAKDKETATVGENKYNDDNYYEDYYYEDDNVLES